jgi:type VI protein secretion system component VasK
VLQRLLLASKEEGQQKNLFKSHCSVKNKVCDMIIDNGSTDNLVSQKLVEYFKLPTEPRKKPYTLGLLDNSIIRALSIGLYVLVVW